MCSGWSLRTEGTCHSRHLHGLSPRVSVCRDPGACRELCKVSATVLVALYLNCKLLPRGHKRSRITPRFIQLTLAHDEELEHLTQRVIIPQGGVKPYVHPALSTRTYKPVSGSGSEKGSQLIHQELRIPLHKGKKNFCFELLMEVQ